MQFKLIPLSPPSSNGEFSLTEFIRDRLSPNLTLVVISNLGVFDCIGAPPEGLVGMFPIILYINASKISKFFNVVL